MPCVDAAIESNPGTEPAFWSGERTEVVTPKAI